uniref:Uncharacterized protein n=1 Tax=Setaria viridis TaxID=4556 RepID=A0A4U6TY48_SETVI|nr:hypothetical protein SEVIR_7G301001v2 [Setaria viridis]
MPASATATSAPRRLPRAELDVMHGKSLHHYCLALIQLTLRLLFYRRASQSSVKQRRCRPIHPRRRSSLRFHPPKGPPAPPQRPTPLRFSASRRQAPNCRCFNPPAAVTKSTRRRGDWKMRRDTRAMIGNRSIGATVKDRPIDATVEDRQIDPWSSASPDA